MDNYNTEWSDISSKVLSGTSGSRQDVFVAPSTCCGTEGFTLGDVLSSNWLTDNIDKVHQVSVQRYPNNNCRINGQETNPQDIFSTYLNHGSLSSIVANEYASDSARIQGMGKELVMLETNTGACGGFPGLSTSFGAAMWYVHLLCSSF
jgi:hypothetical protein